MGVRQTRGMTGCCVLLLGLVAGAPLRAAEPAPEAVLKERGLTRSGSLYLLDDAEAAVLEQIKAVQPYYVRLKEVGQMLGEIAKNDADVEIGQRQMDDINSGITWRNNKIQ